MVYIVLDDYIDLSQNYPQANVGANPCQSMGPSGMNGNDGICSLRSDQQTLPLPNNVLYPNQDSYHNPPSCHNTQEYVNGCMGPSFDKTGNFKYNHLGHTKNRLGTEFCLYISGYCPSCIQTYIQTWC